MQTSYDEVPYPSYAHRQTHPDRLATMARLFGLDPAPVDACRVLEIGAGDGSNLIPMAYQLPGSTFLGIDLAASAVDVGQRLISLLGLRNIDLRAADLMEFPASTGAFDYIVAHGFYSWVPPAVQDRLLDVCACHLSESGVALVSYNAYPGFYFRQAVREQMRHHVRNVREPASRIAAARELVKYIAQWANPQDHYRDFMKQEMERVLGYDDSHFFHDDLADINLPCYFHEFMDKASSRRLQFLAEADFYEMQAPVQADGAPDPVLPPETDIVAREQYLDFLRCRRFRQTLLCREDVRLVRPADSRRVRELFLSSSARPLSDNPDLSPAAVERFKGAKGAEIATDHPVAKAALLLLGQNWPRTLSFNQVLKEARARLHLAAGNGDDNPALDMREFSEIVLKLYGANFVELHSISPSFALEPGARPVASRLARAQLEFQGRTTVTNLRHTIVEIKDPLLRRLLSILDGTRSRDGLLAALRQVESSVEPTAEQLEITLRGMGRMALLEA